MKLSKLTISLCLGLAYCLLLAALVGSTWSGINSLRSSTEATRHIVNVNVRNIDILEEMSSSVHLVSRGLWTLPLLPDEAAREKELRKIDEAQQKYNAMAAALAVMPFDDNGQRLVFEIAEDHSVAVSVARTFINMSKINHDDAAAFLLQSVIPVNTTWQEQIERLLSLEIKENRAEMAVAEQNYLASLNTMTGIAILISFIVFAVAWISVKLLGQQSILSASIEESRRDSMTPFQAQARASNMPSAWDSPQAGLPDTQLSIARVRNNPASSPTLEPSTLLQQSPTRFPWLSAISKMQQMLTRSRPGTASLEPAATAPENGRSTVPTSGNAAKNNKLTAACDRFLARQNQANRATSRPRPKPVLRLVSNRTVKTGC